MSEFPPSPVSPSEFFEGYLADSFAALALPASLAETEIALGICLAGEGGGEWVVTLGDGALRLGPGPRTETTVTWVQSVDDWRGALWEGRGGAVADRARAMLRTGVPSGLPSRLSAPSPQSIERLAALDGLLCARVTGEEAGDWALSVKFGPGELPDEPTATISLHHEDANALARGELAPLDAFLAGRISVTGDLLLVMQLQEWAVSAKAAHGADS